jgi:UDP:flavonoid glycosyltransferase YjiC (YdhE family)
VPAVWPEGDAPRLFVYLRGDYAAIDVVLQQLALAPCRTLVHAVGLTPAQRERRAGARLRYSDGAVAMDTVTAQADAVLCHAGSGTVCTALQAGLPLLMLPMQIEQMICARRVLACGAGEMLLPAELGTRLQPALARVLGDAGLRQSAQALAGRHRSAQYGDVVQRLAERCITLAESG